MRMKLWRVAAAVAVGLGLALAANSTAGAAALNDGDIRNDLSSAFSVHIATLDGNDECRVWNRHATSEISYEKFGCQRYWLPTGQTDDGIRGNNYDTDAFMVTTNYYVNMGGSNQIVTGNQWTRIHGNVAVRCAWNANLRGPLCHVWVK